MVNATNSEPEFLVSNLFNAGFEPLNCGSESVALTTGQNMSSVFFVRAIVEMIFCGCSSFQRPF